MTCTQTQQPEALRLADVLEQMPGYDWNKTYCEAAFQLRHIQHQNERLHAEIERLMNEAKQERTARIEAQQQLADAQELAAKAGLAHRKAVQEAVREALQEAQKACENLPAPDSCSGVERSLWDVATMACAEAVGNVGTP